MAFKSLLLLAFILISARGSLDGDSIESVSFATCIDEHCTEESSLSNVVFRKCVPTDNQCIKDGLQEFMRSTSGGKPEWGVKPIDPLTIPSLDVDTTKEAGMVLHYKNLNVAGFKNLQVTENNFDLEKSSEFLKIQADLTIVGDLEVEFPNVQKTFKGPYSASTTIIGSIEYPVDSNEVDGKQYFVVRTETINSKSSGETTVTVGDDLRNALAKDEDAVKFTPQWESNNVAIREKVLTAIADYGFATIVGNIRALGTRFDKTVFLKQE